MPDGLPLDFHTQTDATNAGRPLIIDSFAGGGGASTGIEMALGRSPDVAINHSPEALALHEANHPDARHLINSIYSVDPREATDGRLVGLAWFSPDCKHFSKAKGGKPVSKNIRDLAWVVVHWAEQVRPQVILLENVEEFITWGPLRQRHDGGRPWTGGPMTADLWEDAPEELKGTPVFLKDGTPHMEPCPIRKGQTFNEWVLRLRRLGYKVEWRELRACDYGAPTIRKRLFVVARCDGQPIHWPEPTHGAPGSDAVKSGTLKPWRTAAECIDWDLPCPSIFDSKEAIMEKHGLRAVRPLARATQARVARGMIRYVLDAEKPFIVNLTHGARTEDATEPFRTITGANRGEKAAVVPSITRFNSGATGQDLRDPLATVTANSWIKKPGGCAPLGVVAPSLASYYSHNDNRGTRTPPIEEPLRTITTERRHSVVAPHHTICANFKDQNSVIIPALVQTGYGERPGQAPRTLDPHAPLGTIVAGGVKHASVATFLAQHNTGIVGHDAREPLSTVSARGSHQQPVAAWFAKYYGTGDGARHDDPCHTTTTKDRFAHCQAALQAPPFGPEHEERAREVAAFLRAHAAWDGGEFVTLTIDGGEFVIVDIGMRMLTPRELFRAQGFPEDYVIEGVWKQDGEEWAWHPFSKNVQISCCGNSVCPPLAAALAEANCGHLIEKEAAA